MNSRPSENECFVYIALPGQTEFVTAGRFVLATDRRGNPVGKFVYGRRYLESDNPVAIDPLELKLANKTYETNFLKGIFGALRDSSPDYWGRRVIEKLSGHTELDEVDYLLHSADDRAGALGFGRNSEPPAPRRKFNQTMELQRLQEIADAIIADEEIPDEPDAEQARDLIFGGTSMGGARPKAVVEDDNALWIAEFNRLDDKWSDARVEHAMMMLARDSGIHTVDSKVITIGNRDVLMVKRFDREHTQEDAPELFRRMVFNALISNIDDHPRNHAVVAMDTEWKLSPAYDLTPSTPISTGHRDHALEYGDMKRFANAENLLTQCKRFYLEPEGAKNFIDQMEAIVRDNWYAVTHRAEVTEKDSEKISTAFNYPGFRLAAAA